MCGCGISEPCYGCPCGCNHLDKLLQFVATTNKKVYEDLLEQRKWINEAYAVIQRVRDVVTELESSASEAWWKAAQMVKRALDGEQG